MISAWSLALQACLMFSRVSRNVNIQKQSLTYCTDTRHPTLASNPTAPQYLVACSELMGNTSRLVFLDA